jgi:CrcB protein
MGYLLVFLGGGLGSMLRHGVNQLAAMTVGTRFPFGTLFINISGSFVMGLVAAWFAFRSAGSSQEWRLFLATGVLGGYTTFSTFSLEVALLYERGEMGLAALYIVASVILGISGLFAGTFLVRTFS